MALAELETLARLRFDVTVVVFNYSTLSLIAIKQNADRQGGDRAVSYGPTNFAAVAQACRIDAERVADVGDYERAPRESTARPRPSLLDVAVAPAGSDRRHPQPPCSRVRDRRLASTARSDPEPRSGSGARGSVGRVGKGTSVHGQAATADAGVELVAKLLEDADALVELRTPTAGETLPSLR